MSNRMRIGILWLLAQGVAGCGADPLVLPTAPTSTPTEVAWTNPFLVSGERWNLTTTFTAVTGPEACVSPATRASVGNSFNWVMAVERSGESMRVAIISPDFETFNDYVGTFAGDEFSVTSAPFPGSSVCGGVRVDYQGLQHVSGRFSADGRIVTAEEATTGRFSSGEVVNWNYRWSATRQ